MADKQGPWERRTYDFVEGRSALGSGEGFFLDIERDVVGADIAAGAQEQNLADALDRVPMSAEDTIDLEVGMVEGTMRGILRSLQQAGVPESVTLTDKLDNVLFEYNDRPAYLLHFTLLSVLLMEMHDATRSEDEETMQAAQNEFNVGKIVVGLTNARMSQFYHGTSYRMYDALSQVELAVAEMSLSDTTRTASQRLIEEIRKEAE